MKIIPIFESSLIEDLCDLEFAASYLESALKEGSLPAFRTALKNVAVANGGMQKLSQETRLGRESMYKALSEKGNPQFSTLAKILETFGLRFAITTSTSSKKVA